MRFVVDDQEYRIEFERKYKLIIVRYDYDPVKDQHNPVYERAKFPYTTANIFKVVNGKDILFRTYTVGAHFKERFTLESGRVNALRMITKGNSLSKAFKKALWDAYHERVTK